jgi:formate hydrogenlyase subunit 3/multisubunit Na+/H+ antiporter MnhD subunit
MQPALWLIVLPLAAAPLVYLFRRTGLGALVAALVTLFLAWLALRLPAGVVLNVLGRTIELNQSSQLTLSLLFVASALLFLISSASGPFIAGIRNKAIDAGVLTGAGRTFYPLSLGVLGVLAAAILSRHLGITAILVQVAAILGVFVIQGSRLASIRAAQRFLVLISLALPIFLLIAWRIDLYQFAAETQTPRSLQQTALLVGIGFALWLAVVPFHSWVTATTAEASPASAAFILLAFPVVALLALIQLLADAPWLVNVAPLGWAILVAGGLTAGVGGLMTGVQRGFSGLMGYAALYDLGCTLVVLGLGGPAAVLVIFVGLAVRALALTLLAASVSAFRLQVPGDGFAQMSGLAARLPVATAGVLIGGLTLAGAPLTVGFALRWQLLQGLAHFEARWALALGLAGLGVTIGYLRGLRALLAVSESREAGRLRRQPGGLVGQEPFLLLVIITLLGLACLLWGLFPDRLIEPVRAFTTELQLPL